MQKLPRLLRCIVCLVAVFIVSGDSAHAYRVLVKHPNCPTTDKKTKWRDYMSGNIPAVRKARGSLVGVNFRVGREKNLLDEIGSIDPKRCYTVYFITKARKKEPLGYISQTSKRSLRGLPGDPNKYEINVDGVLLHYTEAGEILDHRGRVVGEMTCFMTDKC